MVSKLQHSLRAFIQQCGSVSLFHNPFFICHYYGQPDIENAENAVINRKVRTQKAKYVARIRQSQFKDALMMVERPYRMAHFLRLSHDMPESTRWELADWLWRGSEHGYMSKSQWLDLFSLSGNPNLQVPDFQALPDEFEVFRVESVHEECRGSIALRFYQSERLARSEASRYFAATVSAGVVRKADVLHVVKGMSGLEFAINPEQIMHYRVLE